MRTLVLHAVFASTLLAVSFAATGCIEQKVVVEVQPDGSGTLQFSRTLSNQLGALGQLAADDGGLTPSTLAEWRGVAAWTDVEAKLTEDGRFRVSATGWFEDLSQVAVQGDDSGSAFILEREGDVLRVGVEEEVNRSAAAKAPLGGAGAGAGAEDSSSLLTAPPHKFKFMRGMVKGMLGTLLKGFRQETRFRLPAAAADVTGFATDAAKPREVVLVRTGEDISAMMDLTFDGVAELRAKVDAGEVTREEAEAQLKAKVKGQFGPYRATCVVPTQERDAQFAARFAEAKAAWQASDWPEKVAQARAEAEAEAKAKAEAEANAAKAEAEAAKAKADAEEQAEPAEPEAPVEPEGNEREF